MSTNLLLVSPYNVNFYGGVQNQVKLFKDGLDKTNFNVRILAPDSSDYNIGNSFKITAGPRVRQDDLLGTWPGLYPTDFPLFGMPIYAGSVGAYNLNLGAGASITWNQSLGSSDFLATALYVALRLLRIGPGDEVILPSPLSQRPHPYLLRVQNQFLQMLKLSIGVSALMTHVFVLMRKLKQSLESIFLVKPTIQN